MKQEQYLDRLHTNHENPSLTSLSTLQKEHLQRIPFENLDVIRQVPIYLNLETMFEKVIGNKRGGYCYELNGLFHSLLTKLGYEAHLVSATVLRPDNNWAKADTHAAILVYLDQPYLVDVGFGAHSPRVPVPLNGIAHTNIGETYKIEQQSDGILHLIREVNDQSRVLYRFSPQKKSLLDFHEGCVFNQVSKDSTFTHTDIISLATANGRITLKDHLLTVVQNGHAEKTNLSAKEKEQTLANIFKICLK